MGARSPDELPSMIVLPQRWHSQDAKLGHIRQFAPLRIRDARPEMLGSGSRAKALVLSFKACAARYSIMRPPRGHRRHEADVRFCSEPFFAMVCATADPCDCSASDVVRRDWIS